MKRISILFFLVIKRQIEIHLIQENMLFTHPIDTSFDIKPWCVPIVDALKSHPKLGDLLDDKGKLDFGDPIALSEYNKAVFFHLTGYSISVPDSHLIPAACLRYAYVRYLHEQLLHPSSRIIEIGTGASGVIALFCAKFGHSVHATEINASSMASVVLNVSKNHLDSQISIIESHGGILHDVIPQDSQFDALLTYPPTYPNTAQDLGKLKKKRGFKGVKSELIGGGLTGFEFSKQMLQEAISPWYSISHITALCLFKTHVNPTIEILKGDNRKITLVELITGTRKRYIVIGSLK